MGEKVIGFKIDEDTQLDVIEKAINHIRGKELIKGNDCKRGDALYLLATYYNKKEVSK